MHCHHNALLSTTIVLTGLLTLPACTSRNAEDEALLFDIPGPLAVDVETFGGDVRITADPTATQARVRVDRWADFGEEREGEAETSLEEIQYTAGVESGPEGPVLSVRATTSHPEPHRQRANISITVPAAEGVRIITHDGEVTVIDAQGSATIEAGDEVAYMTNWPLTQPLSITTQEGGIDLRIRGESRGDIRAETLDGDVTVRNRFGELRMLHHDGRRLHSILNDGENEVVLRAVEGDVSITVVDDPTERGWWVVRR
jgi:hypothetical protein